MTVTACWHRYVRDIDGLDYCERCYDCPAERIREAELDRIADAQALGTPEPVGYIISGE